MVRRTSAICIYLDNLSVVKNSKKIPNKSSQVTYIKFCELVKLWLVKEEKILNI